MDAEINAAPEGAKAKRRGFAKLAFWEDAAERRLRESNEGQERTVEEAKALLSFVVERGLPLGLSSGNAETGIDDAVDGAQGADRQLNEPADAAQEAGGEDAQFIKGLQREISAFEQTESIDDRSPLCQPH